MDATLKLGRNRANVERGSGSSDDKENSVGSGSLTAETAGFKQNTATMDILEAMKGKLDGAFGLAPSVKRECAGDDLDSDLDLSDIEDDPERCFPQFKLKEKLYQFHYRNITNMNQKEIKDAAREVLPQLDQIVQRSIPSERYEVYKNCDGRNFPVLRYVLSKPFTKDQDFWIRTVLQEHFFQDYKNTSGQMVKEVNSVLYFEAILRIYAMKNGLALNQAENEMKHKANYGGILSEELLLKAESL